MCVFNKESYINLLKLLITSISVKSNINKKTTDILIITSPSFKLLIEKELFDFHLPINYYLLELHTLFEAGCARLNIFNYDNINQYDNILYLDTDVLVNGDLNIIFDTDISSNKIYALEEGTIGHEFWGASFFNFSKINIDTPAFTSGILYFKRSHSIMELFEDIKHHITDFIYINNNNIPCCLDQPFIVYNSIMQNKYDNTMMKKYVENNPSDVNKDKIIYHFPGCPGFYENKYDKMTSFWIKMNEIPRVLFQTNKKKNEEYVLDMINLKLGAHWDYKFYSDDDIIKFFEDNPVEELHDIIQKYNSIISRAHKADLFRYYYLYVNGGVFMDSDAMIYANIEYIVKDFNFVSVNSSCHPGVIFQGILGASPKNEIIKRALFHAYNTEPQQLQVFYHYLCKQLYDIIKENTFWYNIKLYNEQRINDEIGDDIFDENHILLFKHYWKYKIIPQSKTT
jgi:lipopolysaccharide biosynthesis glycosyltransferase